jgi:hypothetical protein
MYLFILLIVGCSRATRRRITNEDELIAAISPIVEAERIEFSGMTFKEQVLFVCISQHFRPLY